MYDIKLYFEMFDDISFTLVDDLLKLSNCEELKRLLIEDKLDISSIDGYLNIRNRLKEVKENLKNIFNYYVNIKKR